MASPPQHNLPWLGEVLWSLPRPQWHFGPPSQCWIIYGGRGSRGCRHGIGGARLTQSAAGVGCPLKLAYSVVYHDCVSMPVPNNMLLSRRYAYRMSWLTPLPIHSTPIGLGVQSCPLCGLLFAQARTWSTIPRHLVRASITTDHFSMVVCLLSAKTASKRRAWSPLQAMRTSRFGLNIGGEDDVMASGNRWQGYRLCGDARRRVGARRRCRVVQQKNTAGRLPWL
jgi:hypothetical protein